MSEAPAVALRLTRLGSRRAKLCPLGCWATPHRERNLARRTLHWGTVGTRGPSQKSWAAAALGHLTVPCFSDFPCVTRAAGASSSSCLLPAPKPCLSPPHLIWNTPSISTGHLSSRNGLPFTFHFPPQMPGKTTWRAPRAGEIGGAGGVFGCWLWISRKLPQARSVPGACPPTPILFEEP